MAPPKKKSHRRKRPGSYRLRVVAVNGGGTSKAATADFKVKR